MEDQTPLLLNDVHRNMLETGKFSIDGWCSPRGVTAANELLQAGYVTMFESGSDEAQYTARNYTITGAGRAALAQPDVRPDRAGE